MDIIDELWSYDQELLDDENKIKLLRALPESYKPIAIGLKCSHDEFK